MAAYLSIYKNTYIVLTKFQDLSGLYPNPNKSDIFLSGVLNAERE